MTEEPKQEYNRRQRNENKTKQNKTKKQCSKAELKARDVMLHIAEETGREESKE